MGIFSKDKSETDVKPTLLTQIGAGSLIGAFLPWGSSALQGEQAARAFGGNKHSNSLPPEGTYGEIGADNPFAPFRRYVADYDPYSYIGSRGGDQQANMDILNNSLYGRTAQLDQRRPELANQQYQNFLQSFYGGGQGADRSSLPQYPQGWNATNQPGRSWDEDSGTWKETSSGSDITWDSATNTTYYHGIPLTDAEVQAGMSGGMQGLQMAMAKRGGMNGGGQGLLGMLGEQANQALGGNQFLMQSPQRPNLPDFNLPDFNLPNAPQYDAASYARNMLNSLQGDGSLDKYVQQATEGMRNEYQKTMADQVSDLQSKYNYEGGFLGSPMFAAQGQLQGEMTSNYLRDMGLMQLDAANKERDRIFGLTGQGMGTQADYLANTYGSQAGALSSAYGSGVGALGNAYGSQLDALSSMYGNELGAFSSMANANQSSRASIINNAMQYMNDGYAKNFDQAMEMATNQQKNQQSGLDAMYEDYYKPGNNMLQILSLLLGIPMKTESKSSSGGLLNNLAGAIGQGTGSFAQAR